MQGFPPSTILDSSLPRELQEWVGLLYSPVVSLSWLCYLMSNMWIFQLLGVSGAQGPCLGPKIGAHLFHMLQSMGVVEHIMNKHGHCCKHNDPMLNGDSARMGTQIIVLVLPTRRGCTSHNCLCLCCPLAAQAAGKYVEQMVIVLEHHWPIQYFAHDQPTRQHLSGLAGGSSPHHARGCTHIRNVCFWVVEG